MAGASAANRMWTYPFCRQSRHFGRHSLGIAFHHAVNTKAGKWPAASIHEDMRGWSFIVDQRIKYLYRMRPQRTKAHLVPLAADLDRGVVSAWNMGKTKIVNAELRCFIGASAGIV